MSANRNLLFFTYANSGYYIFVLPYIYFALSSTNNSSVEIILESYEDFSNEYSDGLAELEDLFPGRFLLRQSKVVWDDPGLKPHVIRFLEEPLLSSDFVYIGDIDILIFEDILDVHLELLEENKLPFSNIIRKGTELTAYPRLTGLHFARYSTMYPLPDVSDLDINNRNDENVLYEIMKRKGVMVPVSFRSRPICGIHVSMNRDAVGRYSVNRGNNFLIGGTFNWGIKRYSSRFISAIREMGFSRLYFHFSLEARALLMVIEAESRNQLKALNRIALDFLVDKRLTSTLRAGNKDELIDNGYELLKLQKYEEARVLFHGVINVWPSDYKAYLGLASVYEKLDDTFFSEFLLDQADELAKFPKFKGEVADLRRNLNGDVNLD